MLFGERFLNKSVMTRLKFKKMLKNWLSIQKDTVSSLEQVVLPLYYSPQWTSLHWTFIPNLTQQRNETLKLFLGQTPKFPFPTSELAQETLYRLGNTISICGNKCHLTSVNPELIYSPPHTRGGTHTTINCLQVRFFQMSCIFLEKLKWLWLTITQYQCGVGQQLAAGEQLAKIFSISSKKILLSGQKNKSKNNNSTQKNSSKRTAIIELAFCVQKHGEK